MQDSVLVTGCNGFVGRHLTKFLRDEGENVVGLDRQPQPWADWLPYGSIDISDSDEVLSFVDRQGVTSVYHLAAVASPVKALESPHVALKTNVLGSGSFCEASRKKEGLSLLLVGSMEEYRRTGADELQLTEESPLEATTVYGMTKLCAELVGKSYVNSYGCRIIFTRTFNHTGPGQLPEYVLSSFAMQCAQVAAGKQPPVIRVGNIDIFRDFLDVSDVVRAYRALMLRGTAGKAYNVSSLECYSIRKLLDILVSLTGIADVRVVVDRDRLRQGEPRLIHGDTTRLRTETQWTPTVPIHEVLSRIYAYWTQAIANK